MTFAPADLLGVRNWIHAATGLPLAELGIVGDAAHAASGGYHEGRDDLVRVLGTDLRRSDGRYDYSVRQARDRTALTNAASALDVGNWPGLRAFSTALVAACRAGDPRGACVREVIYSDDGAHVRHWDAIGEQSGGDDSHLWHTHISFWRDTEGRRSGFLSLVQQIINGGGDVSEVEQWNAANGVACVASMLPSIAEKTATGGTTSRENVLAKTLTRIEGKVDTALTKINALGAVTGADPEVLRALVRDEVRAAFADAGTPD